MEENQKKSVIEELSFIHSTILRMYSAAFNSSHSINYSSDDRMFEKAKTEAFKEVMEYLWIRIKKLEGIEDEF